MEYIPNLPSTNPPPTPPESPRKRRQLLRDSEDTEGFLTVETYIARSDPYRSTTIQNPPPWPLFFDDPPQDALNLVVECHPEIIKILTSHGFSDNPAIRLKGVRKPGYPENGNIPTLLLQILYHLDAVLPRRFGDAKDKIRDLLIDRSADHNIHVEIAHSTLTFQPSLFPIKPDDESVKQYECVKEDLITVLNTSLGKSWRLLCLCLVGNTEEKARRTIVVMVDPLTSHDWSNLAQEMSRLLQSEKDIPIFIEFLPGSLPQTTSSNESETGHPGVSYVGRLNTQEGLEMGCSTSVCGELGGGTMGGFVSLSHGKTTRKGFITNYHAIRAPLSTTKDMVEKTDRFGLHNKDRNSSPSDVSYLADKDIKETRKDAQLRIKTLDKQIEDFKAEEQERELVGTRPSIRIENGIKNLKKEKLQLEAELTLVDSMPITIGQVRFASGEALIGNQRHVMDWAFIELAESSQKLFKQNRMPDVPLSHQPIQYGLKSSITAIASAPLDTFGAMMNGSYYIKSGRTTGVTAGVCNGTLATCNWSGTDRVRYDEHGNEAHIQRGWTEEYVVFSKRTHQAQHEQTDFCAAGDSGALVINDKGQVCGLLYGAMSAMSGPPGDGTFYVGAGLVMSMENVVKSIKAKASSSGVSVDSLAFELA